MLDKRERACTLFYVDLITRCLFVSFIRSSQPNSVKMLLHLVNSLFLLLPLCFLLTVQVYFRWLDNIRDWCVSRQLWWGHRIPVWYIEGKSITQETYVVARNEEEAMQKARAIMDHDGDHQDWTLRQEDDVLDTWFSSGLWPFSTLGWPKTTDDLQRFYPTSVMETG